MFSKLYLLKIEYPQLYSTPIYQFPPHMQTTISKDQNQHSHAIHSPVFAKTLTIQHPRILNTIPKLNILKSSVLNLIKADTNENSTPGSSNTDAMSKNEQTEI